MTDSEMDSVTAAGVPTLNVSGKGNTGTGQVILGGANAQGVPA
jgi:hypothetical protein